MLEIVLIVNLWGSRNSRPKRNKKERLVFPINSHQDKFDTAHPSFLTTMGKRVISWIQWNIFEINLGYQFWGSDVWWELQNRSCFRIEYDNQHWDEESKYRFVIVNMSLHKNQTWTPSITICISSHPNRPKTFLDSQNKIVQNQMHLGHFVEQDDLHIVVVYEQLHRDQLLVDQVVIQSQSL